jgi:hypothetical protein
MVRRRPVKVGINSGALAAWALCDTSAKAAPYLLYLLDILVGKNAEVLEPSI